MTQTHQVVGVAVVLNAFVWGRIHNELERAGMQEEADAILEQMDDALAAVEAGDER